MNQDAASGRVTGVLRFLSFSRLWAALSHGPILRNLGWAVVLQGALLVSGVLSARILGPENRGYLAFLATWSSTLTQLGAVGLSLSATYYLASRRVGGSEIVSLLKGILAVQVVGCLVAYGAIIFGYIVVTGAPIAVAAALSLWSIPAAFAVDAGIALALGGRRHGLASGLRAVAPVVGAIGLIFVYLRGDGTLELVAGVTAGSAVAAGAVALVYGLRTARSLHVPSSLLLEAEAREVRREIVQFGFRGYVGYLSPTDSFRLDQLVVGLLLSPRTLGIYAVGAAFTTFTRVVALNIGLSGTPEVAKLADPDERRRVIRRTFLVAGGVTLAITVVLSAVVPFAIPILFGKEFDGAVIVAELLLVAGWVLSMKRIAVDLVRGVGDTRMGTRAEGINLMVFFVLCIPGGLIFGGPGVAGSLAVSAVCGLTYLVRRMDEHGYVRS